MAIYLVGADDTSFFKKRTTWDFTKALEVANDGDIIELEKECTLNLESITIEKNITIRGYMEVEDGTNMLYSKLPRISVRNNAQVTLENFILEEYTDEVNILNVKGRSTVTLKNILFKNHAKSGTNYPIIFVGEQSTLNMNSSSVDPGSGLKKGKSIRSHQSTLNISSSHIMTRISIENSNLSINETPMHLETNDSPIVADNSNVSINDTEIKGNNHILFKNKSTVNIQNINFLTSVKSENSKITIKDAIIKRFTQNAFIGFHSNVTMDSVELEGGLITDKAKYPCALIRNSNINFNKVDIIQPNYNSALVLNDSNGVIDLLEASSVHLLNSKIDFKQANVHESLFIQKQSTIAAHHMKILGRFNGKVNLQLANNSSFKVDEFFIGKDSKPNIVLDYTSTFDANQATLLMFDEKTQNLKIDEDGFFIPVDKEIDVVFKGKKTALLRLNELIGIENIKEEVQSFIAVAELNKKRVEQGSESTPLSLHSLFLGNPGTGKTSVARLIGEILYEKEIISEDIFVEVSRSDLIAGYLGQTALKTKEVLESARGGVLFIDEAYSLSTGDANDYGIEAINEILKFMEDFRSEIVIIFAGYTNDMYKFLEMNDGLRSRIPNHFDFPDYTIEDLGKIGLIDLHDKGYNLNENTYLKLIEHQYERTYDQSNGRWVRNLNDLITRKMALRVMDNPDANIHAILDEDLIALMD